MCSDSTDSVCSLASISSVSRPSLWPTARLIWDSAVTNSAMFSRRVCRFCRTGLNRSKVASAALRPAGRFCGAFASATSEVDSRLVTAFLLRSSRWLSTSSGCLGRSVWFNGMTPFGGSFGAGGPPGLTSTYISLSGLVGRSTKRALR